MRTSTTPNQGLNSPKLDRCQTVRRQSQSLALREGVATTGATQANSAKANANDADVTKSKPAVPMAQALIDTAEAAHAGLEKGVDPAIRGTTCGNKGAAPDQSAIHAIGE